MLRPQALHADHLRIARGLLLGVAFVLLGRLAGAGKEIAIAWRFGVSGEVDAFQLATTLVGWVPTVLASVAGTLLVPALVKARHGDGVARRRLLGELTLLALLLGAALTVIGLLAWPWAVGLLATGLSEATRALAVDMSLQLLPLSLTVLLVAILSVRLQACERHVVTLLEALPAAVLALSLLVWSSADAAVLVWGSLAGALLHVAVLGRLATAADGAAGWPGGSLRAAPWPELWRAARFLFAGQLAMSCIGPIDQFAAASLGDSAVATLGYANRLVALLCGLGALSISRAALPVFTDALARDTHERDRARGRAIRWAWAMAGAGTLAVAIGWQPMHWAVALLFERGAFGPDDTQAVAQVARWGLLQLPFLFGSMVMVQWHAAAGDVRPIATSAWLNLGVKVALNLLALSWLGLAGLMLATAGMYACSFAYLLWAARRPAAGTVAR